MGQEGIEIGNRRQGNRTEDREMHERTTGREVREIRDGETGGGK